MTVKIEARGSDLRRIGQIDDYDKLTAPLRFNATGTWLLDLDDTTRSAAMLRAASGIVVTRNDEVLFSGDTTGIDRKRSGKRRTLAVNGVTDDVWLERRLALPVPSGPPYTAAGYDVQTGPAETVLLAYVDRNLGPAATVARRLTGLTLAADAARGAAVSDQVRFDPLLTVLQRNAIAGGGLGFRIVQVGAGLEFQVYEPADRSRTAVFSPELGNLSDYGYKVTAPGATYVYVGGGGEGVARVFAEGGDATAITAWYRAEAFKDRRDTTDTTVLGQTRDEALAEGQAGAALTITPVDTSSVAFGTDYNLGDVVTVVIDGDPITDVVRQVVLTVTAAGGEVITPVVGTPDATAAGTRLPAFLDAMRRLGTRVGNLERRK